MTECFVCGKPLENSPSSRKFYCSTACRNWAYANIPANERPRQSGRRADIGEYGTVIRHVCCDCGRPTPNHRCTRCLYRWRVKHGVPMDADD